MHGASQSFSGILDISLKGDKAIKINKLAIKFQAGIRIAIIGVPKSAKPKYQRLPIFRHLAIGSCFENRVPRSPLGVVESIVLCIFMRYGVRRRARGTSSETRQRRRV